MIDPLSISRAETLHPAIRHRVMAWLLNCSTRNIGVRIAQAFRSHPEQDALYQQGRTIKGPVVTKAKAGYSWHNYGLAFDFVLLRKNKSVSWNMKEDLDKDGQADWMEAVEEAKRLGFEWGGDWKGDLQDYPHFDMTFGLTISQARARFQGGLATREGYIPINEGN